MKYKNKLTLLLLQVIQKKMELMVNMTYLGGLHSPLTLQDHSFFLAEKPQYIYIYIYLYLKPKLKENSTKSQI